MRHMKWWVLGNILCNYDPKAKVKSEKAGICDGVQWNVVYFMFCVSFAPVHCCLVVTCWERAELMALVCDVQLCFATFRCGT